MSKYVHLAGLLVQLKTEMKHAGRWSEQSPDDQALASTQPFATDTLSFEQWLQFIFIPRFSSMIDQRQPLPDNMALLPMAQMTMVGEAGIHHVLAQLDEVVCGRN